jgi:CheY-like chemotaxis protein
MNRLILRKLLENKHARIAEAANGKEALNLFAGNPPGTFAAILMDILMPVMGGHRSHDKLCVSWSGTMPRRYR